MSLECTVHLLVGSPGQVRAVDDLQLEVGDLTEASADGSHRVQG